MEKEYDMFDTVEITSYSTERKIRGFLHSDVAINPFFKNNVNPFFYYNKS